MSFLARIAARAIETSPSGAVLQPKERLLPRRFLGQRTSAPEEAVEEPAEETSGEGPARRTAAAASPLSRSTANTTESTGWDEEDYDSPTTEGTPARRMPMTAAAPTPLRREPSLAPGEPPPEETPKPEQTAGMAEPNPARALRRRGVEAAPTASDTPTATAPTAALPASVGSVDFVQDVGDPGAPEPFSGVVELDAAPAASPFGADWPPPPAGSPGFDRAPSSPPFGLATPANPGMAWERPSVVIEQIDVLIHEPIPAPTAADRSVRDRARSIDARYLRRL